MQNFIRLFIWDPISTLVGAYKINKCIPKVFLPHEILWSISPIGVFPNEYSLNISRQCSKPFLFLKCPALRWSGECSNCFVRVTTSACYGHVMHTSLGARFSVAGQRFVVEFLWFFQTFRRCDVKSWTKPSWIAMEKQPAGLLAFLETRQKPGLSQKRGRLLRKCREKLTPEKLRWFCTSQRLKTCGIPRFLQMSHSQMIRSGDSLVAFFMTGFWPGALKTYFRVGRNDVPFTKSFGWGFLPKPSAPRPFFEGEF